eukprot:Skav206007  [mRNA]  locus=scaffold2084:571380:573424:- [translate_table: standard]
MFSERRRFCRERERGWKRFDLLSFGSFGAEVQVIVFCQSVNTAHRLTRLLQICCALRGRLAGEDQEEEDKTDDEVVEPCSDVVARGIDIPEVTAVVNYSAPSHIQTYIHRVGRTARAGKVGHTFTFVTRGDMERFEKMLRESKFPIPKEARSRKKVWWSPALEALQRCLDAESKGHLSVVKPIDEETLMGTEPKAAKQEGSAGRETAKRRSSDQTEENASEKVKQLEEKKSEPVEKSESMLDFLKGCGWGT